MRNPTVDISSFDAQLRGVVLPIGLRLDTVDIKGKGLHIEKEPFLAEMAQPGELSVTVLQEALAEFLNVKSPGGLRDFDVSIQSGKVYVQATKNVFIDVRATAVCVLRIVDGTKLYVDLEAVEVFGGGGLTNMVRSQIDALNPIFETTDLPFKAILTSVESDAGRVLIHGKVEP